MSWPTSQRRNFSRSAAVLLAITALSLVGLAGCQTTGDPTVDLPGSAATSSKYVEVSVSAATVLTDPALTLKTNRYLVGRLRDQVTGLTEARGVLNLRPSTLTDSLPGKLKNAVLESVVLIAPFEQVYGTGTAPLRYDVLTLAQKLDEQVVYAAIDSPTLGKQALATGLSAPLNATRQVTQTASDGSGTVITTTVPDMVVRQTLLSLGQNNPLLTTVFQTLNATVFSQADLDAALPGLVLAPSAGYEGSLVAFGRGTVGTQLKFRFSYDSVQTAPLPIAKGRRSYSLFFGPGRNAASSGPGAPEDPRYYTQLTNDRTGSALADLTSQSHDVPAAALGGRTYLQEGIGLGTRITFNDLSQIEKLRNTPGVAINQAELRVPVQPYTTGLFPNPAGFYALEVGADNKVLLRTSNQITSERILPTESTYGQMLINPNTSSPYYSFLLTRYLQAYLTPKGLGVDEAGNPLPLPAALVLTPTLRSTTSLTLNRAVLDANAIVLRVYYSQLR